VGAFHDFEGRRPGREIHARKPPDVKPRVLARRGAYQPREERNHALALGHRPNDYGLNFPGGEVAEDPASEVVVEAGVSSPSSIILIRLPVAVGGLLNDGPGSSA